MKTVGGVSHMLSSSLFVSLSALFAQHLSLSLALPLLLLAKFTLPVLLLLWLSCMTETHITAITHWRLQITRSLLLVLCQLSFFYYLMHASLFNAIVLFMTSPLFVPLISRIFYKTPLYRSHCVAAVLGFIGVLCVLQPSTNIASWIALFGLSAGFFNACSQLTYHRLSQSNHPLILSFHTSLLASLFSGIILIAYWLIHPQSLSITPIIENSVTVTLLILMAITSVSSQVLRSRAYKKTTSLSLITPLIYTSIVFSVILDWLVFDITPNGLAIIGAILITSSALIAPLIKSTYDHQPSQYDESPRS